MKFMQSPFGVAKYFIIINGITYGLNDKDVAIYAAQEFKTGGFWRIKEMKA